MTTTTLGAFSISLAVKDLATSQAFYERLGFTRFAGDPSHYALMKNGAAIIGLFQGMFEKNILTFNPGWDASCNTLPDFVDVRALQRDLRSKGIEPVTPADESATSGPGSLVIVDPDGNPILLDQHV